MTDTSTDLPHGSVWDRLRRRKVVQWGLLYVAGTWGLLQGVAYLRDTFNLPQAVQQIATLLLVIGLPIVLVLAWYHGDRGEQRVRGPELAIVTLLLLLGGGALWYYQRASDAAKTAAAEDSKRLTTAPETGVLRLAILPLQNLSPDPANAFFADGLRDEILSAMSATRELQVVSGTTMRTYAHTRKTVKQIATELSASHVLEGSLRRAGEKVRLTLQLIDAATDSNVWSRTFDRQLRDALSLQSEVASEVATALDVRLLPAGERVIDGSARTPAATSPVAYDLYLKGKLQLDVVLDRLVTARDFDRLEKLAAEAIEIDPGFADAYTVRARSLLYRLWFVGGLTDDQWRMIDSDLEAARRLAGDATVVLATRAYFEYYGEMDYVHALATSRAALARSPNDVELRELEGLLLRRLGQWDDAIIAFRALVDREPLNPNNIINLVQTLQMTRRYVESLAVVDAFERRAPSNLRVEAFGAYAHEAIQHDPEILGRFLDEWQDRLDPRLNWVVKQSYLSDSGRAQELASHLLAAIVHEADSGFVMPAACLRGYGRMLRGDPVAPDEARDVTATAARIGGLPSRQWNVVLLEAHAALLSGDRKRSVERAKRVLGLMPVERDALLGRRTMVEAATVLAWAGEGDQAVQLLRRASGLPGTSPGWTMVRDPLLAVPLARNAAFEVLRREVDSPN
ncbi:MAG TPA: hypothetical protein VL546_04035 [Steroidobacteraceae bacterium]|nr:hypothetical protein [Steroidobacteraceae bacterium]